MEDQGNEGQPPEDVYNKPKASKFNFKSKSERRSKRQDREDEADSGKVEGHFKRSRSERGDDLRREYRTSRKKHKREHRHQSSRTTNRDPAFNRTGEYDNPDHRYRESIYDGIDDFESAELNTEDAFRESLFDALADDEGAAYWEGVYGQPIHVYSNTKPGSDGKLERMNDEEYAEYVRTKMWEKSHQHILEEREAREKARRKQKDQHRHLEEEAAREEEEREKIRRQVQQTLKRGEERKKARELDAAWENYTKKWADLKNTHSLAQGAEGTAHELIPWPVLSGKSKHVSKEEVEYFFNASKAWKEDAAAMLKGERVRWHPDKMQQRFGQHINQETMKLVTAVFQVVDRLWNEQR